MFFIVSECGNCYGNGETVDEAFQDAVEFDNNCNPKIMRVFQGVEVDLILSVAPKSKSNTTKD